MKYAPLLLTVKAGRSWDFMNTTEQRMLPERRRKMISLRAYESIPNLHHQLYVLDQEAVHHPKNDIAGIVELLCIFVAIYVIFSLKMFGNMQGQYENEDQSRL